MEPRTPPDPGKPSSSQSAGGEPAQTRRTVGTYQMLWDCNFCDTRKLLGLDHRYCPNCGAPQDAERRYFPSDEEKIAVENHVYVGADKVCGSCRSLASASSRFCPACGASLEGARQAAERTDAGPSGQAQADVAEPSMENLGTVATASTPSVNRLALPLIGGGVGLLILIVVCVVAAVLIFASRDAAVEVTERSWRREIQVEVFGPVSEEAWRDEVPAGASGLSCSRRVRDTIQVEDGETCRIERIEQGDGTFREEEVCEPVYRSEEVYDDFCTYTVERWAYARSVEASGLRAADKPVWPALSLQSGAGDCRGCEREGQRIEEYVVTFAEQGSDETYECAFNELSEWERFTEGSLWDADVGAVVGGLRCDSLAPR